MPSVTEVQVREQCRILGEQLDSVGISLDSVKERLKAFEVEVPSWVFGVFGGGRFGGYMAPGPARNRFEKIHDAAFVHKLTGAAPRVAIHTAWDCADGVALPDIEPGQFAELRDCARAGGVDIGAVNPTLFLDGTHLGSLSSPIPGVREQLIEHCILSARIAEEFADGLLTYWLPDGSAYPGQCDLWEQERLVREALCRIYAESPDTVTHLVEYKLFEPGTYSTIISDAGAATDIADGMGPRAGVLVDMGHHALGVNIAQIVARLIGTKRKGGFHFNTRYAADDDHSVEPNIAMYAIFCELVAGGVVCAADPKDNWTYMIDQCSSLENRMRAVLHSIDSLHVSLARALILDRAALEDCRAAGNIIGANRVFLDAFLTDVRPILYMTRLECGLPMDSVAAYDESGYQQKIEKERG